MENPDKNDGAFEARESYLGRLGDDIDDIDDDDDLDGWMMECGYVPGEGVCMLAGTEYCDWDCPFNPCDPLSP